MTVFSTSRAIQVTFLQQNSQTVKNRNSEIYSALTLNHENTTKYA